jgi:hypothetical protein
MKSVNEPLTKLLNSRLQKYTKNSLSLTKETCLSIYQDIFDCIVEVVQNANVKLNNESVNYLAQQYYDAIKINSSEELDSSIFTQRAKLEEIETKEIALLAVMMNGSPFCAPLLREVKRRS